MLAGICFSIVALLKLCSMSFVMLCVSSSISVVLFITGGVYSFVFRLSMYFCQFVIFMVLGGFLGKFRLVVLGYGLNLVLRVILLFLAVGIL